MGQSNFFGTPDFIFLLYFRSTAFSSDYEMICLSALRRCNIDFSFLFLSAFIHLGPTDCQTILTSTLISRHSASANNVSSRFHICIGESQPFFYLYFIKFKNPAIKYFRYKV